MTEPWTTAEDGITRKHYPNLELLLALLRGRTNYAIQKRAGELGLTKAPKEKYRPWTGAEIVRLRSLRLKHSLSEVVGHFPGRSYNSVKSQLYAHGVSVPRRRMLSEFQLLEDIRALCRDTHVSYRSIERKIGPTQSLSPYQWQKMGAAPSAAAKACEILGGELYVAWDD